MITELAQMKIFALKVQEPGGAAIIFPKSGRNQNPTPLHNDAAYFKRSEVSLLVQFVWGFFAFY